MTASVPDYAAGSQTTDPDRHADAIVRRAGFIRRRCNEITAASELNASALFALAGDCAVVRDIIDFYRSGADIGTLKAALIARTREIGIGNPEKNETEIQADWAAVYTAIGTFLTWAESALPGVDETFTNPVVTVRRRWPSHDFTITVAKPAPVQAQITALRAVFV